MGDRRPFFRFLAPALRRRLPMNMAAASSPPVAMRAGESINASQLNGGATAASTSTAPLKTESRENLQVQPADPPASAIESQPLREPDLPSEESGQIHEKVSSVDEALTLASSGEKGLPPATSEQEPQTELEVVSSVSDGDFSGETVEETGVEHGESLVELNEEAKDVKEVVQVQGNRNEVNDNVLGLNGGSEEHMSIGDTKAGVYSSPVNVITLAGENRGASMQMSSNSSTRVEPVHIHRGYKRSSGGSSEERTDGEESSKGKQAEDAKAKEDQPTEAYVNNNAQGINNSIVFYGAIAERNPGVHMAVTLVRKALLLSREGISYAQVQTDEVDISRMGRLMYKPSVRRRCLRGLFLETGDSEPENLEKHRRHGCRVGCQQKDNKSNVDLL